jgi:ferredoxin-thioredoxin reductase catalytic chain
MVLDKDGVALKKQMQKYADSFGFKLNENEKALEGVLTALNRNKKFKGEIYCPCRMVTANKEKDKEIICPCIFHRGEIELQGHCKCQLFFAKEK